MVVTEDVMDVVLVTVLGWSNSRPFAETATVTRRDLSSGWYGRPEFRAEEYSNVELLTTVPGGRYFEPSLSLVSFSFCFCTILRTSIGAAKSGDLLNLLVASCCDFLECSLDDGTSGFLLLLKLSGADLLRCTAVKLPLAPNGLVEVALAGLTARSWIPVLALFIPNF